MKIEEIKTLIEAIDSSSINVFNFHDENVDLEMSKLEQPIISNDIEKIKSEPEIVAQVKVNEKKEENSVAAPTATTSNTDDDQENIETINSPLVGVVYLAPSPDKPEFVKIGQTVEKGETICIVEAMKIMNEIPATSSGKISKILVSDGEVVEYGQPLFEIH